MGKPFNYSLANGEAYPLYFVKGNLVIGARGVLAQRVVEGVVDEFHEEVFEQGAIDLLDHFRQGRFAVVGFREEMVKSR